MSTDPTTPYETINTIIDDECIPVETITITINNPQREPLVIKRFSGGDVLLRQPQSDDTILLTAHEVAQLVAILGLPLPTKEAKHG